MPARVLRAGIIFFAGAHNDCDHARPRNGSEPIPLTKRLSLLKMASSLIRIRVRRTLIRNHVRHKWGIQTGSDSTGRRLLSRAPQVGWELRSLSHWPRLVQLWRATGIDGLPKRRLNRFALWAAKQQVFAPT
jgi:hypothetical protein